MPVKTVNGDLMDATENIIGHQVNCQMKMASGVAKLIREKYPEVYAEYTNIFINHTKEQLLGYCQIVDVSTYENQFKFVANLFGQYYYGYDGKKYTKEAALKSALIELKNFAKQNDLSVALPYKIGSDRGGADWNEVYKIIEDVFIDYEVTLYKL